MRALIGLFGGSFDPFHNGHLAMVEAAAKAFPFERLIVMPVGLPSHKNRRLSFATFRMESARLATAELPQVYVSDYEILAPRRSYTIETIRHLKEKYPENEIKLISGSDFLFNVETWYQYERIIAEVSFAIALRGDAKADECEQQANYLRSKYQARIDFFPMKSTSVSATKVRAIRSSGNSAAELVPEKVNDLLHTYQPYSYKEVMDDLDETSWHRLNHYERRLFAYLGLERRLHTVSTCLLALELAAVHNVPALEAGTAALFHDLAKELPLAEQKSYSDLYLGFEEENPELLHGPAAAFLAREHFGISSADVLNAIQYHTSGRPGMSTLEKIIFLADKIEYGRPFKDLDSIRSPAFAEGAEATEKEALLNEAVCLCFDEVFSALERSGQEICPLSKEAYNILK